MGKTPKISGKTLPTPQIKSQIFCGRIPHQTIIKPTYIRENRTRSGNYGVEKLGRDWLKSGKIRREVGKKRAAPKPIRGFPVSQKWEIWPEKSGNRVLYGAQKWENRATEKWEHTVCMELKNGKYGPKNLEKTVCMEIKSGKRGIKKVGTECCMELKSGKYRGRHFYPSFLEWENDVGIRLSYEVKGTCP